MTEQTKAANITEIDICCPARGVSWLTVIVLSLLIVVQDLPIIQRRAGGYTIFLPFILLFFLCTFTRWLRPKKQDLPLIGCSLLYLAIDLLYRFVGISSAGYGRIIHPLMYLVVFASMSVVQQMNRSQKRFLLCVIVFATLTEILLNVREFHRLGSAYFSIQRNENDLSATNVASTQYLTALMLMSGALFIASLRDRKPGRRLIWAALLIICILFNLLIMQRALILLLSAAMFGLMFIFNARRKLAVNLLILLAVVLFAVVLLNYEAVFSLLGKVIKSARITARLNQISRALSQRSVMQGGGSLTARFKLYLISLNTWTSSPGTFLFGVGDHISGYSVIGNHSQFFDVLGRYGLLGGFCMFYFVLKTLSILMRRLPISRGTPVYRQTLVIPWIFVIRGFMGGVVFGAIAVRLFIFLPIVFSLIFDDEESLELSLAQLSG